jgi:CBS domain-containing protein
MMALVAAAISDRFAFGNRLRKIVSTFSRSIISDSDYRDIRQKAHNANSPPLFSAQTFTQRPHRVAENDGNSTSHAEMSAKSGVPKSRRPPRRHEIARFPTATGPFAVAARPSVLSLRCQARTVNRIPSCGESTMTIGSICKRSVVVAPKDESIVDAAKRMRMMHVGTVIVVDERDGKQVPIGILTDRDIVLSVVASNAEQLPFLAVSQAMSDDLLTAGEDTSLADALRLMQERGVRRLPVLDHAGALVGIVTADDVIRFLAEELAQVVKLMNHEEHVERRYRV